VQCSKTAPERGFSRLATLSLDNHLSDRMHKVIIIHVGKVEHQPRGHREGLGSMLRVCGQGASVTKRHTGGRQMTSERFEDSTARHPEHTLTHHTLVNDGRAHRTERNWIDSTSLRTAENMCRDLTNLAGPGHVG
jgi:hypothetical protein